MTDNNQKLSSGGQDPPSSGRRCASNVPPLPPDAPLLSIEDAAAYLRRPVDAVRRMIDGRSDGDDGIGQELRGMVVRLSARRRYLRKPDFFRWLYTRAGVPNPSDSDISGGNYAAAS